MQMTVLGGDVHDARLACTQLDDLALDEQ